MVELLKKSGAVSKIALDIGHVGVYRGLAEFAQLTESQEQELFSALQRKAVTDISALLDSYQISSHARQMLQELSELNGDKSVLARARTVLDNAPNSVKLALDTLEQIAETLSQRIPDIAINFDLAELRGYDYHTGVVFAAYKPNSSHAIAAGGRYDDIGEAFGLAQPATGFSLDLKKLATQLPTEPYNQETIGVQWAEDSGLHATVKSLRESGKVVVYQFPGSQTHTTHILVKQNGHWQVTEIGTHTRG
jgi:ATP phosphoribosyltransferase regulatory subunit